MGNYNVLITNPQGERRHYFHENVGMDEAKKFLREYGAAPIGWFYQLVNLNKQKHYKLKEISVLGYTEDGSFKDERKAGIKMNDGKWYRPRHAKRDIRSYYNTQIDLEKLFKEPLRFKRTNVYETKDKADATT